VKPLIAPRGARLWLVRALSAVLLLPAAPLGAQPEAILTITPGGHTGRIHDVVVTRDRRYLITTGDDKTIRVWDVEQQRLAETLVGQIGDGLSGQLYALALSPDNRWLAVAGYLDGHVIRLYDWPSRRLVGLLEGHTNVVNTLAFTDDSRGLLSGSADRSIRLWDVASRTQLRSYLDHGRSVVDVATAGRVFVSASLDGTVRLWSLDRDRALRTSSQHSKPPDAVAISEDGQTIASGADDARILIYDAQLNVRHDLNNAVGPSALAFAPSGRKLLTGSAAKGQDRCHVWERLLDDQWRQSGGADGGYAGHDNTVMAVNWLDERQAVSAGGNDGRVAIWTLSFGGTVGGELDEEALFTSQGRPMQSVATTLSGRQVAYTALVDPTAPEATTFVKPLPTELFDLTTGEVSTLAPTARYEMAQTRRGQLSLSTESGGPQGRQDAVLVIRRGTQRVASVARTSSDGFRHRAVTWAGARIVSGGNGGVMYAYDENGGAHASLVGHEGDVLAVAPTADGRRVWSASADQTLALWNLGDIDSAGGDFPSLAEAFTGAGWQRFFARPEYRELSRQRSRSAWNEVIRRMKSNGDRNASVIENRLRRSPVSIQPLLRLFVGRDGEWVLWHPSGYYSASADGEKYIAWHVNHGPGERADRYPVAYFRARYYKPELIERILITGSLAAALKNTEWIDPNPDQPPVLAPPTLSKLPTLRWIKPIERATTQGPEFAELELEVESPTPVRNVTVLVNGRPAPQARGLTPVATPTTNRIKRSVSLVPGDNEIIVEVENADGRAASEPRSIHYASRRRPEVDAAFKPTLYALHIGVSRYADPTLNLNYARKDAEALHAAWQAQAGGLFKEVKTTLLTDAQATRRGILRALSEISKEATQRDLVLLTFAGHGVNDLQNRFYLLPHEVETADLVTTAIRYSELTDLLGDLPGKVLVMLDACHSGNFARQGLATRNVQVVDEFVRELTSSEVGVVVMAASTGRQPSVESAEWGHGAFTKAVLDALKGKGDYNRDNVIAIKELDLAVTEGVKVLTKGQQKPVTYTPANLPSFPVYMIRR